MKLVFLSLFILVSKVLCSQTLTNQTIASGFHSKTTSSVSLTSSIGEGSPVQYLIKSGYAMTQGYLQVDDKVISAIVDITNNIQVQLFPNPCHDFVHIDLFDIEPDKVNISIFSLEGKLMENQYSRTMTNTRMQTIDVSKLAASTYICTIQFRDEVDKTFTIKFLKK